MNLQSTSTTISKVKQTAVPSWIMAKMNLEPGDKLLWYIDTSGKNNEHEVISLKPLPKDWGKHMRGLGKHLWKDVNVEEYIKKGRQDRKLI